MAQGGARSDWRLVGANPKYQVKITRLNKVNEGAMTSVTVKVSDPDTFADIANPLPNGFLSLKFEHRWVITCSSYGIVTPAELAMVEISRNSTNTLGVVTISPSLGQNETTIPDESVCTGGNDTYVLNLQAPTFPEGEPGPIGSTIRYILDDTGPSGFPGSNITNANDGILKQEESTGIYYYEGKVLTFTYVVTKAPPVPKH